MVTLGIRDHDLWSLGVIKNVRTSSHIVIFLGGCLGGGGVNWEIDAGHLLPVDHRRATSCGMAPRIGSQVRRTSGIGESLSVL